uniref:Calcipressin-like protein n=1 Tax=Meloidogyne incognita TaxID=6306 RepID=A0A914LGX5_MELIC
MNVLEKRPPVVTDLTEEKQQQQQNEQETVCDKEILPTAIIIRDVPKELFDDPEQKSNFRSLFQQITCDTDPIRIDFLKSFQRVRIVFEKPEHATAAKLLVEHHSFNGAKMKAFFAKNIKMARRVDQDEQGHLKLPPLEKQFLISPPSSPPVGWVQHAEMAPVVCNLDLMSRLASLAVDDKFELYEGDEHQRRPSIVVTPCGIDGGGGGKSSVFGRRVVSMDSSNNINVVGENDSDSANSESEQQILPPTKVQMPHTPRPPTCNKE